MYNWNQFRNLPRIKDLTIQEQSRQYWMYQNNSMNESSLIQSASSAAAGAGSGGSSNSNYILLVFDDISNTPVAEPSNLEEWNNFFFITNNSTYDRQFKSVVISENSVYLYGGKNIGMSDLLFSPNDKSGIQSLISIEDSGSVISTGYATFFNCLNLSSVILPSVTYIGPWSFYSCLDLSNIKMDALEEVGVAALTQLDSLTSLSLPSCTTVYAYGLCWNNNLVTLDLPACVNIYGAGIASAYSLLRLRLPKCKYIEDSALGDCHSLIELYAPVCTRLGNTSGFDYIFYAVNAVTHHDITLTIPASLMTNNGGQPDGDIQYLQINSNLTIITT